MSTCEYTEREHRHERALLLIDKPTQVSANQTSCDDDPVAADTDALFLVTYAVVMPTLCCVGLVSNVVNLCVLRRGADAVATGTARAVGSGVGCFASPAYVYLRCLAVADLLAMAFCLPMAATRAVGSPYASRWVALYTARLSLFLVNAAIAASNLLVLAFTTERYVAVCRPTVTRGRTHRASRVVAAVIGIYSVVVATPELFAWRVEDVGGATYAVVYNGGYLESVWLWLVWPWLKEMTTKMMPIAAVAAMNPLIVRRYRRRARTSDDRRRARDERRLLVVLAGVCAAFVVLSTPSAVATVMYNDARMRSYAFVVFVCVSNCMEIANNALNFYVYSVASSDFRRHLRHLCACNKVAPSMETSETSVEG
ncbi:PREDICTED: probable G-protein coupled receptor B0563.6 [Priapulus caudatus]|uniref:Probable G-protein coupled receptor B0563.6 n=1 Tax=Priapulus caudatus TaxID=37621 RepID=A0ABM1EDP4_PRICU|nr:PREDICTED: probable G-protein coupled receptor B0563.6 [Priapulus caudatus]